MITNNDVKELEYIGNSPEQFTIHWKMTNWCNYRCSYCSQKNQHSNELKENIMDDAIKVKKFIDRNKIFEKYSSVRLALIGGEIGFYDLPKIIESLGHRFNRITIITNLSAPKEYWKKLLDYCNETGQSIQIIASYHEEFASADEFLEKCTDLKDCVKSKMVITEKNIDMVKSMVKKYKELGIKYEIHMERKYPYGVSPLLYDVYSDLSVGNKNGIAKITLNDGSEKIYKKRDDIYMDFDKNILDPYGLYCNYPSRAIEIESDMTVRECYGKTFPIDEYTIPFESMIKCGKHFCSYCDRTTMKRNIG